MRLDTALRYWRTVRHLTPRQVLARLTPAAAAPADHSSAPPLRRLRGPWLRPAARPQSMTGERVFLFLNDSCDVSRSWEPAGKEKLWLYNLHYFDDLNAAGAEQRKDWHERLIAEWVSRVPPRRGTGWEPYPVSLRIVNWIKWAFAGNPLGPEAVQSLAVQARWLARRIEWHILGNHLFSNAKALIFAGTFFSGPEAEKWLRDGVDILRNELDEQILSDGGHFERSPMYHSIVLEDVLDLVNLFRCTGGSLGAGADRLFGELQSKVAPMLGWLQAMSHPDGEIGFFNDAAIGTAPPPAELVRYAFSLGFAAQQNPPRLLQMPETGFVRMSVSDALVIADIGDVGPNYLPGHAHAETLSFEMALGGRRLIVNSGTSVYGSGSERLRQRGTAAHSTVVVDGVDSSEVWAGFRVGRRAATFAVRHEDDGEDLRLRASHSGYRWLAGRPVHSRTWVLGDAALTVIDDVEGKGIHSMDIYLHLAPWIYAEPIDASAVNLIDTDQGLGLAEVRSDSGDPIIVESGSWHPKFGVSVPNSRLRIKKAGMLPLSHMLSVRWTLG